MPVPQSHKGYSRALGLSVGEEEDTEEILTSPGMILPAAEVVNSAPSGGLMPKLLETIGALAGLMTTAAFLPQVIEIKRTGDVSGLSLHMYIVFVSGVGMWILYGISKKSPSLVAANAVTFILSR